MVDLALADNATPIRTIAASIVATVMDDTPADECARLQRHYNLTHLPVVDGDRLKGVILAESLLGATVEQDTRQMQRVANVAGETVDGPLASSVRTRLPWLTVNLATTFLAAATVALFESTLTQAVVLAAFLPVVAGQGGIGGTQTLTLIVRAIALGELVGVAARRLLVREAFLGLVHGVWLGVLVAVVVVVWKQNIGLGLILGVAMLGNMLIAGSVGAAVPLFLRESDRTRRSHQPWSSPPSRTCSASCCSWASRPPSSAWSHRPFSVFEVMRAIDLPARMCYRIPWQRQSPFPCSRAAGTTGGPSALSAARPSPCHIRVTFTSHLVTSR